MIPGDERSGNRREPHAFDTGLARLRAYLAGLSAEHWLLFAAGLVIGLVLG